MIKQRLESFLLKRRTLFGAGLIKINCVKTVIKMVNEHLMGTILIASRILIY